MLFPKVDRIVYKHNPLIQVICQFHFPTILKIESQIPYQYQESIRHVYPLFSERIEGISDLPLELTQLIPKEITTVRRKFYDFRSTDRTWVISLARESIGLTATQYKRWGEFKSNFEQPLQSFTNIYAPTFFSRIGLRYQNLIKRTTLGLGTTSWSELIQPHLAGSLSIDRIGAFVTGSFQNIEFLLDEETNAIARVQHGLVMTDDQEQCYLIDADFFFESRTEVPDGLARLDRLNHEGTKLFRWCITDRLHQAMGPEAIS